MDWNGGHPSPSLLDLDPHSELVAVLHPLYSEIEQAVDKTVAAHTAAAFRSQVETRCASGSNR